VTVATNPPVLAAGERIAEDYEVVGLLHRSRTLDVYDVRSDGRDCRCVAKVVRPDRAADEQARRALVEEGRLLLSLAHPHVVRAYEVIEAPDAVVVLELLSGRTLRQALTHRRHPLPVGDLARLGSHVCAALDHVHRRGIVHLDVKPSNVLVHRGTAKLIDFSVARPPGPLSARVGTRRYMSPEQARVGEVGPAADVWGAGMILYQAATGRHVFEAAGEHPQLEQRAMPVALLRPRLPRRLAAAIDSALDPDPDARPTVGELRWTCERPGSARRGGA
jgi:serine/threonine protein kinase